MRRLFPGPVLPTTVVGSYPVVIGRGIGAVLDPYKAAVRTAVEDQLAAGIDIISDGQVRGDMVKIFSSALPGIRGQEVIGPVSPAPRPITLADTRYALTRAPRVKGIVTGPTTLSYALHLSTPAYRNREELAIDLARVLAGEAAALEKAGIAMLQVDEPALSVGAAGMEAAREALAVMTRDIRVPLSLHVCGNISGIIGDLPGMPVDILDFEFARSPDNLTICRDYDLGGKMIGFGCVDSSRTEVETAGKIRERIERGLSVYPPEQLLIDPDCGLRMLDRASASEKLVRMVRAVLEIRADL